MAVTVTAQWRLKCADAASCTSWNPSTNEVKNFAYTGNSQGVVLMKTGNYKIEVWGAQGSNTYTTVDVNGSAVGAATGGYGGYSYGTVRLNAYEPVYIYVAQMGLNSGAGSLKAYPNGGAVPAHGTRAYTGGGGSTYVTKTSNKELYQYTGTELSNLLIVAGGGGGACNWWGSGVISNGGHGGGYTGGSTTIGYSNVNATGGTQNSGGLGGGNLDGHGRSDQYLAGAFGKGGGVGTWPDSPSVNISGGGGGGYYGGGASWGSGGAGGSGYIANSVLSNKGMYMYNVGCTASSTVSIKTTCTNNVSSSATSNYAKSGNGYAKITYLGS